MINHVRTLLLNKHAKDQDGSPWAEFVPDTFRPRQESTAVKVVRGLLFGATPDAAMLNYRLLQVMPLLHLAGVVEHTLAVDSRVTYTPLPTADLHDDLYTPRATLFSPTITDIALVGTAQADTTRGIIAHNWHVAVTGEDTVRVTRLTAPRTSIDVTYTLENGRSSRIPLPGSNVALTFVAEIGDTWMLELVAKPNDNLYAVVQGIRERLTEPYQLALFGANPTEPAKTWRNLWLGHPYWQYQLAGLLLAVADNLHKSQPSAI